MQYCLAAALLDRQVGLQSFTDEQVMRGAAQSLIPRIDMRRIPGNEGKPSWTEGYNEVEVHPEGREGLESTGPPGQQRRAAGVTLQEIEDKFRDCASLTLSGTATRQLLSRLDRLEEAEPISSLADLLRGVKAEKALKVGPARRQSAYVG